MLTSPPRFVFSLVCLAACAESVTISPFAADAPALDANEHTPDAAEEASVPVDAPPPDRGCVGGDPSCDPDTLPLPITIADMTLDREGNLLVAGTLRSPAASTSRTAAVARVDPRRGIRLIPLIESSPRQGQTSADSASPTYDGGAWVVWGPCPSVPADDASCVSRLPSLAATPTLPVRGISFEGPPRLVRSLADGGAIVATQGIGFGPSLTGRGTLAFQYVEVLALNELGAVRWRSAQRGGALDVAGLAVGDDGVSTLVDVGNELVLESWTLDGEALLETSLGATAGGSAITLASDRTRMVALVNTRARGAPGGDLTLVEVPPHGGPLPARPLPVRVDQEITDLRVASSGAGRGFVMFQHVGPVTVEGVATRDREGVIIIEAPSSGGARVVAELPWHPPSPPAEHVVAAPAIVAAPDGRLVVALNVVTARGERSSIIRWLRP